MEIEVRFEMDFLEAKLIGLANGQVGIKGTSLSFDLSIWMMRLPLTEKENQITKSFTMELVQFEMPFRQPSGYRRARFNLGCHSPEKNLQKKEDLPLKVSWIQMDIGGIFCISCRGKKIEKDVKVRMNMKCGWK